jgi:hypothetical protein
MNGLVGSLAALMVSVALGACTAMPHPAFRTTPATDAWLRAGQPALRADAPVAPWTRALNDAPPAAVRDETRRTLTGRVTDIDHDAGHVTIRTPEDTIHLVVPPSAIAPLREGDDVAVDVRVMPSHR